MLEGVSCGRVILVLTSGRQQCRYNFMITYAEMFGGKFVVTLGMTAMGLNYVLILGETLLGNLVLTSGRQQWG